MRILEHDGEELESAIMRQRYYLYTPNRKLLRVICRFLTCGT